MSSDSDKSAGISIDEGSSQYRNTETEETRPAQVHLLPGQAPPPTVPPRRIVRQNSTLSPYQSSLYLRDMSEEARRQGRDQGTREQITERGHLFEKLNERFGASLSVEDFENSPTPSQNMVPTDAEVEELENHLFAKTRATTPEMKMRVFRYVIDFFVKNGTSDQVDLSRTQVFPTGVKATMGSVWKIPTGHKLRSSLRYQAAQDMARYLSTEETNAAILRARADERGIEVTHPELLFDFVYLPMCGQVGQYAREVNRFRRANLRESRGGEAAAARGHDTPEEFSSLYDTDRA